MYKTVVTGEETEQTGIYARAAQLYIHLPNRQFGGVNGRCAPGIIERFT